MNLQEGWGGEGGGDRGVGGGTGGGGGERGGGGAQGLGGRKHLIAMSILLQHETVLGTLQITININSITPAEMGVSK